MKINHNFFSNLAFNLAEKNLGRTGNNPSVGCVVVKNNSVVSSGSTSLNGRPHAEFNALNKKIDFQGSNMYVTLEPCTHYGLTPPCTNIIKDKKINKIFYSFNDPDKRTHKRAKKVLKKITKMSKINHQNKDFYKSYFLNKKNNFPLIDAKLAISKDYYSIKKDSRWITNLKSRKVAHFIRSKYDCIVSTSYSINKDNSLLNCRIDGLDNHKPDLIIIDRKLKLKKNLKIFDTSKKRKIYVFTSCNDEEKLAFFKKNNIRIIKIKKLENKQDFQTLFKKIYQIGMGRVLIESGLIFLSKLYKFKLLNDLYLFKSDRNLNKNGYNNCKENFLKNLKINQKINVNLKDDILFKIRIK